MNTTGPFTPGSGAAIIQRAMGGGGRHGGEGGIILPVQEVPPPPTPPHWHLRNIPALTPYTHCLLQTKPQSNAHLVKVTVTSTPGDIRAQDSKEG